MSSPGLNKEVTAKISHLNVFTFYSPQQALHQGIVTSIMEIQECMGSLLGTGA